MHGVNQNQHDERGIAGKENRHDDHAKHADVSAAGGDPSQSPPVPYAGRLVGFSAQLQLLKPL
jgi:hypothetical protein